MIASVLCRASDAMHKHASFKRSSYCIVTYAGLPWPRPEDSRLPYVRFFSSTAPFPPSFIGPECYKDNCARTWVEADFQSHALWECMDSSMLGGKKPIRGINLSISRRHLITISPVAVRSDLCHDF